MRLLKLLSRRGLFLSILFVLYTAWIIVTDKIDEDSLLFPFLFAPLLEEIVFRYSVLEIILRSKSGWRYIWQVAIISSFIFAMLHNHEKMFLYQFVFGFFMSYVYIRYRNLWYCIILHAKWNIFVYFGLETVKSWF